MSNMYSQMFNNITAICIFLTGNVIYLKKKKSYAKCDLCKEICCKVFCDASPSSRRPVFLHRQFLIAQVDRGTHNIQECRHL